jgi:sugar phosphate isomerase/epimerase
VIGEYYWDGEVFPNEAIWGFAVDRVRRLGEYAKEKDLEVVIELEPFTQALVKDVDELARFVREVDHPAVKANADISHLHLARASFDDVKKLQGMIGHIHLSDCDGEKHGDLPAGRGVTPIKDYLKAIADTGYSGTVSIELEYSPDPDQIVEWVEEAYRETATIMSDLGVRAGAESR